MNILKRAFLLLPFLALVYMYLSQGIGVLIGSTEHYDILATLGWSPEATTMLVWLSVVVDLGMALALLIFPSGLTFLAAALWTWVPRIITAMAPGIENEFLESLAVLILAALSYLIYRSGQHVIPFFKKKQEPVLASGVVST